MMNVLYNVSKNLLTTFLTCSFAVTPEMLEDDICARSPDVPGSRSHYGCTVLPAVVGNNFEIENPLWQDNPEPIKHKIRQMDDRICLKYLFSLGAV